MTRVTYHASLEEQAVDAPMLQHRLILVPVQRPVPRGLPLLVKEGEHLPTPTHRHADQHEERGHRERPCVAAACLSGVEAMVLLVGVVRDLLDLDGQVAAVDLPHEDALGQTTHGAGKHSMSIQ